MFLEKIHSINSILLIIRELDHKRIEYDDFEPNLTLHQIKKHTLNKRTSNIESLTKWFEFGKSDDKNFKALVLPYPKVDFTNLPDRIEALKDKIEDITRNHDQSYYRQEVIKRINDLGFNNSLSINTQMNINDKIMAWFKIILKIDDRMCYPQNTIDYLFMVLIPETATRLIMEDIKCEFDKARKIIEESVAYENRSEIDGSEDEDVEDE
ncbi:2021_t:CDS:2 [Gigaspora margarita]|uniref:Restriction of telomere capping protein 4 n=1 Tax=Gigaspora margarita TaxID=4874 RepID=A0ABM8VVF6_GIGMA|nr:2021_t:CDS:2 [Gigaspora margarita]